MPSRSARPARQVAGGVADDGDRRHCAAGAYPVRDGRGGEGADRGPAGRPAGGADQHARPRCTPTRRRLGARPPRPAPRRPGQRDARPGGRRDHRDLLRGGGAADRGGAPRARRRHLRDLPRLRAARSPRSGSRRCPRPSAASTASATSRAATARSRPRRTRVAKTLLTGATGFIGSHVARALVERGDELRVTVREDSPLELLEGLDCERGDTATCSTATRCAGRCGASTASSTPPGVTSVRPEDAERAVPRERGRHQGRARGGAARGRRARRLHLERGGARAGAAGRDRRRDAALHRRPASASRT